MLYCDLKAGESLCFKGDGFRKLIYLNREHQSVCISDSESELRKHLKLHNAIEIDDQELALILRTSVSILPQTVVKDLFVIGPFDRLQIIADESGLKWEYFHENDYFKADSSAPIVLDELTAFDQTVDQIANYLTRHLLGSQQQVYFFHSAGKDSNTIALALAKLPEETKSRVTFLTLSSPGDTDESRVSEAVANHLGFKHRTVQPLYSLNESNMNRINRFYSEQLIPCLDSVSLAYFGFLEQVPEIHKSIIIDGSGNDFYMPLFASKKERFLTTSARLGLYKTANRFKSERIGSLLAKRPIEVFGMSGFSIPDIELILGKKVSGSLNKRLLSFESVFSSVDMIKTDILTSIPASEMHMQKVRAFASFIDAKLLLPFMDEGVRTTITSFDRDLISDSKKGLNKRLMRVGLKYYLGLDSDKLGKLGFTYDLKTFVLHNYSTIEKEVVSTKFFSREGVLRLLNRLEPQLQSNKKRKGFVAAYLIYRLFILALYLKGK